MTRTSPFLIFDSAVTANAAPSHCDDRLAIDLSRRLRAEATKLEAWYGKNAYSNFLLTHGHRPDPNQAATIGRLIGARVKAADGRMYPSQGESERKAARAVRRKAAGDAKKALEIQRFLKSIAELAAMTEDPTNLLDAMGQDTAEPEIREQFRDALEWLMRFAQEWKRREAGRTD